MKAPQGEAVGVRIGGGLSVDQRTFTRVEGQYVWVRSLAEGLTHTAPPSLPQHLAAQQTYNHLDISVAEALKQRTLCLEGVLSCQPHESLGEVIDRIVREQVPHTPAYARPTHTAQSS